MEPPLCVVFSWLIKRVYTILISNTINGSSNLDNCFYLWLILTLITSQKFSSTPFYLLFIILYSSPPCGSTPVLPCYLLLRHSCTWDKTSIFWSCQVFGAVSGELNSCINYNIYFIFTFLLFNFCFFCFVSFSFVYFFLLFSSYTCMRVWSHTLSGRLSRKSSSFQKT